MAEKKKTLNANKEARQLIVQPDVIDLRDRYYTPSLEPLRQENLPAMGELNIRDQFGDSACTGFALAAVINRQCCRVDLPGDVSPRMLFEMARQHDDVPDHLTPGSTIRGALKGFYHNGVCDEKQAPYVVGPGRPWELDVKSAMKAREITLGAYFRLNHEINDYHAATNEAGAIMVSAKIHSGWANPPDGVIKPMKRMEGRHAFAIVGYTTDGFVIQNSWGTGWGKFKGREGVALWTYSDWFENVEDAWVLRLAISSPSAFDFKFARNHAIFRDKKTAETAFTPRRLDIHGHYLHLDDGRFVTRGRYTQNQASVDATARLLRRGAHEPEKKQPYKHLLIFAHGALSDTVSIAKRIRAWKQVYKNNGIYPIHIMWETGFNNEVVDVVRDLLFKTRKRMGQEAEHLDARLEEMARPLGHKLWRDLKVSVSKTFEQGSEGKSAIGQLLTSAHKEPQLKVHFASTSAGALLLAELADVMTELEIPLETANLLAPACSIAHYRKRIVPHLGQTIRQLQQYSLIDRRETNDSLDIYSKSLLYLVHNALEAPEHSQLLGMQKGLNTLPTFDKKGRPHPVHKVFFAGKDKGHTNAKSHSGFDRDEKTMNSVLKNILQHDRTNSLFMGQNLENY